MPGSPQQNRLAERWNRTILDKMRSMIHSASLSLGFWELAADAAVHIYNRTPSRVIGWRAPHELWASRVPDVSYFRVFGCLAYVHVPEGKRQKLDPRSTIMTFVGYEPGSKGYRLWNPTTQTIVLSRDVTFDESSFPAKASSPLSALPTPSIVRADPVLVGLPLSVEQAPAPPPLPDPVEAPLAPTPPQVTPEPTPPPIDPQTPDNRPLPSRETTVYHTPPSQPPSAAPPPRPQPARIRREPNWTPNSHLPGPSFGPPPQPLPRLRPNPKPNPRYTQGTGNAHISSGQVSHAALLVAAEYRDPITYKEAMASDFAADWRGACQYEIDALTKNGT